MRCLRLLTFSGACCALAFGATAQINLPPTVSDATFGPLLSGQTYVGPATTNVTVPLGATLTIQPGAVIKFQNIQFTLRGTVLAQGTAAAPIVFTSVHDDSVGVPIGTRPPAPADWSRIDCQSGASQSVFEFCEIRFAGRNNSGALYLGASAPVFRDGLIRDCGGPGIQFILGTGGLYERNTIRDCGGAPITGVSLEIVPQLLDNVAFGNSGGNAVRVGNAVVQRSRTIGPRNTTDGVLVFSTASSLSVRGSATVLDLLPGLILKFPGGLQSVRPGATLRARGTAAQPIVLTSTRDDAVGGDSLGDGPTTGAPGDWSALDLDTCTCDCEHVTIRFSGGFRAGLRSVNASVRFVDGVIERSASAGMEFNGGVGPTNVPDVRRCDFRDNVRRPFDGINWQTIPGLRDNTASGNGLGDHLQLRPLTTRDAIAIRRHNTLNSDGVIECGDVTVTNGGTLEFGPGLILKMTSASAGLYCSQGCTLALEGRGDAPIVVTALADDDFGGDTNRDGSATSPSPGAIQGVEYTINARGSMSHVRVRYGGAGVNAAIRIVSGNVRATSIRSDRSVTAGILASALSGVAANWVAWQNLGRGIVLAGGSFALQHATSTDNLGFGIEGTPAYTGTLYSSIAWNNVDGTEPNNFVGPRDRCRSCNGILVDGNLFTDPLFVDPVNGDLRLSPTSLCVGRGDLVQATAWGEDHDGNSRILDHADNGLALPDIGAFEVFRYRMGIAGDTRIGRRFDLTVTGPGPIGVGAQVYLLGPAVGGEFLPPFGVLLVGPLATAIPFGGGVTGRPVSLTIPADPNLVGQRFGIQALIVLAAAPFIGHVTNPLLATVSD